MLTSINYEVQFRVRVNAQDGEVVCVTGNCPELGQWDPHRGIKLRAERKQASGTEDKPGQIWSRAVRFTKGYLKLQYRYFVGRVFPAENEDDDETIIISKWETNIKPRVFSLHDSHPLLVGWREGTDAQHGEKTEPEIHMFGDYDGNKFVSKGWLTDQSHITISLHDNPIKMWNPKSRDQLYYVKCTPIDHANSHDVEEEETDYLPSHSSKAVTTVSVLEKGRSLQMAQGKYGALHTPGAYMVFNIHVLEPETTGFRLDFYLHEPEVDDRKALKHIGYSFLLPMDILSSFDYKKVPITSPKHKPMGELKLDYLLVKPMVGVSQDMSISYQNYWKRTRAPLDIGHRGMGISFHMKELSTVTENTIRSLQEAANHGADMVELDVHLTKDKEAVIYHDFKVQIAYRKKTQGELELLTVPVKDLKLTELQSMKLWHKEKPNDMAEIQKDDLDPSDLQPFPTLQRCLEAVDLHTGFNVEFKYPQRLQDGTSEQDHYFDLNEFLDSILKVIFEHHGGRRLIFSTFDCNTCIALRLKQNRYPVLFLSQADTSAFTWYRDPRCLTIQMAAEFCLTYGLLGVNAVADVLLKDMSLIDYVKDNGLVLWTWGEDNNNSDIISKFKECRVDAVIYDRIDCYKTTGKESVFKLEHHGKLLEKFSREAVTMATSANQADLVNALTKGQLTI